MSDIDSTTLREYLSYDPDTGLFTWIKQSSCRAKVGTIVGAGRRTGYIDVGLLGKVYKAHRLAWFYVYGVWPEFNIDHINGNRRDNRIANLRDVPQRTNIENEIHPRRGNPYLGVSKKRNKWVAQIRAEGRSRNLGSFATPEEARDVYVAAKRKLHAGCTI